MPDYVFKKDATLPSVAPRSMHTRFLTVELWQVPFDTKREKLKEPRLGARTQLDWWTLATAPSQFELDLHLVSKDELATTKEKKKDKKSVEANARSGGSGSASGVVCARVSFVCVVEQLSYVRITPEFKLDGGGKLVSDNLALCATLFMSRAQAEIRSQLSDKQRAALPHVLATARSGVWQLPPLQCATPLTWREIRTAYLELRVLAGNTERGSAQWLVGAECLLPLESLLRVKKMGGGSVKFEAVVRQPIGQGQGASAIAVGSLHWDQLPRFAQMTAGTFRSGQGIVDGIPQKHVFLPREEHYRAEAVSKTKKSKSKSASASVAAQNLMSLCALCRAEFSVAALVLQVGDKAFCAPCARKLAERKRQRDGERVHDELQSVAASTNKYATDSIPRETWDAAADDVLSEVLGIASPRRPDNTTSLSMEHTNASKKREDQSVRDSPAKRAPTEHGGKSKATAWTCVHCADENPGPLSRCKRCGFSKSGQPPQLVYERSTTTLARDTLAQHSGDGGTVGASAEGETKAVVADAEEDEEEPWRCGRCRVKNDAYAFKCTMCGEPKPPPSPAKLRRTKSGASPQQLQRGATVRARPVDPTWVCGKCTWKNPTRDLKKCGMCGSAQPDDMSSKTQTTSPRDEVSVSVPSVGAHPGRQTEEPTARSVRRSGDAGSAAAATPPLPRSAPSNRAEWTCVNCSFPLNDASARQCALCGVARDNPRSAVSTPLAAQEVQMTEKQTALQTQPGMQMPVMMPLAVPVPVPMMYNPTLFGTQPMTPYMFVPPALPPAASAPSPLSPSGYVVSMAPHIVKNDAGTSAD